MCYDECQDVFMGCPISVVDELILIAPAVKLSDFFADKLGRMLGSDLSHSVKVYL